jgi:hypothetical protein
MHLSVRVFLHELKILRWLTSYCLCDSCAKLFLLLSGLCGVPASTLICTKCSLFSRPETKKQNSQDQFSHVFQMADMQGLSWQVATISVEIDKTIPKPRKVRANEPLIEDYTGNRVW